MAAGTDEMHCDHCDTEWSVTAGPRCRDCGNPGETGRLKEFWSNSFRWQPQADEEVPVFP